MGKQRGENKGTFLSIHNGQNIIIIIKNNNQVENEFNLT